MENLKKLVGEQIYNEHIAPKLGTEKKYFFGEGEYIPKGRFDEVVNRNKDYKNQVAERDKQLEGLKGKSNDSLQAEIEKLRAANTEATANFEKQLLEKDRDYAINTALSGSKAKDAKIVRGLLDLEKITSKDGAFGGINEQLEEIKKSHSYLFDVESQPQPPRAFGQGLTKTQPDAQTPNNQINQNIPKWQKHKI